MGFRAHRASGAQGVEFTTKGLGFRAAAKCYPLPNPKTLRPKPSTLSPKP